MSDFTKAGEIGSKSDLFDGSAAGADSVPFDGILTRYGNPDDLPDTAAADRPVADAPDPAAMNVIILSDATADGSPSDGSADANGRFDIVIRYTGDPAYSSYFEAARQRWEAIITSDLPDSSYQSVFVDDLLIDASVVFIDGPGDGTRNVLGSAGPDWIRTASSLPVHGSMRFDSYDITSLATQGTLDEVILHEMGHVLGIGTMIWTDLGLRTGDASYYGFTGANALAEYRALSGNAAATSVPVHPGTTAGSSGSHWAEAVFQNELMTPSTGPGSVMPISRMTIASLRDLGYGVNLAAADAYTFPGGGGAGSVSINDVSITEGDAGTKTATFTVSRSGGSAAFAVNFATADGTAQAGRDYTATNGTLNFASGVMSQTISVTITGDTTAEPSETFFVNLTGATNGANVTDSQGQGTILNDDVGPGSVAINDVTITEGNTGTQVATFTVTRTGGTAPFAVNFATANGTATAGSDYVANSGILNFGSGVNSQTVSVTITGDMIVEPNETFFVNLSAPTNGAAISDSQGLGTITNDDSGPGSISINDVTVSEGDAGTKVATFTVTRTGGIAPFAVNFATANGTATAGSDYLANSGTLNFGSGVNSQTVLVTINGDTSVEPNETFFVNLTAPTNGAVITDNQGQGTINNDDGAAPLPDDFADSLTDNTAPFGRVAVSGSATGNLEIAGDRDWFRVTLTAGTVVSIDLMGEDSGNGTLPDPFLRLYNASGGAISSNDDSGTGFDSQLSFTVPASSTYYIEAGAYSDSYTGTYTVRVRPAAADDYADSFTDLTSPFGQIAIGGSLGGDIETPGDRDWFRVTLTAGLTYAINLQGLATTAGTLGDPYVYLYNASGDLLARDDDSGTGFNSRLSYTPATSGTYYVAAAAFGDDSTGTYRVSVNGVAPLTDFNSDGKSDVLWRNDNGQVYVWNMNGLAIGGEGPVRDAGGNLRRPDPAWHIQDTGDFGGDGKSDVLWRNDNGQVYIWQMNGNAIASEGAVRGVDRTWHIQDTGDFNGDGKSDVLWRNDSGQVYIWQMNGLAIQTEGAVRAPDPSWRIEGTGDFDGDGNSDVLWRNTSGQVYIWEMNGLGIRAEGAVRTPDNSWRIQDTGDYNGDGRDDVLWRNDNGQVYIWQMNGLAIQSEGLVRWPDNSPRAPESAWHIRDSGDFNGDGRDDVSWRNDNGQVYVWLMNGLAIQSEGAVRTPDNSWHMVGHHYDLV